jgi:Chaperone of endosialidase
MTFYIFANSTSSIPLANLDANFATPITLGNTAVSINNTYSDIGNLTLNNVTISSGNATVTKITAPTHDAGSGNALTLQSNSTTALYIDTSQNVLMNTTLTNLYAQTSGSGVCYRKNASLDVLVTSDNALILNRTTTNGQLAEFRFNGNAVGSISYNGSLTLYNQTSDQRLKENIADAGTAFDKISQIKIRSFDWIESKSHETHGVIAQELEQVVPQCVTKGEDNEDGSVKYFWQVDTSPLVPLLIKSIQELKNTVDEQSQQIAALQSKVGA